MNLGQPSNTPYVGSGRTSFNVSGLNQSRLVIPENQKYGESEEVKSDPYIALYLPVACLWGGFSKWTRVEIIHQHH